MPVTLDLSGKRVLVVGASSGIGRGVAELASQSGARVALCARRLDRLEASAAQLRAAGREAHAVAGDVTDDASCRRAVGQAAGALGGLDALVYASGISPLALLAEATQQDWRRVLDVNLVGASQITAAALPHLQASAGRAIYVGSYSARQTLPGISLYSVSKLALSGLVASWRMEHPDVDFTHVVLGNTVGTEFAAGWSPEKIAALTRSWVERGLFPTPRMMSLAVAAETITTLLAVRGFIDDAGVMPRMRDGTL